MTAEEKKAFLEQLKAFLIENKDDAETLAILEPFQKAKEVAAEDFGKFLATPEGESMVNPLIDRRVTDAVKKRDDFHKGNFDAEMKKRIAAEMIKLNPEKSPLEIRLEEMEKERETEKAERVKETLRRQIVEKAAEMKIEPFFIKDYLPASPEEGEMFLKNIKTYVEKVEKNKVNELMANGYKPGSGQEKSTSSKVDLSKLSQAEMIAMEMEGKLDEAISN